MRWDAGHEENVWLAARPALLLGLLILFLRISIAAQFPGNYDTQSFLNVAQVALSGENVYAATDRYNYSPLWSFVLAGIWWASRPNLGLFVLLLGLVQIAADLASAEVLRRIARDRLGFSPGGARWAALLFFSNPVSALISGDHGQFDGFSILFLLAAILLATGSKTPRRGLAVSALLALSVLVKHITVFHPLLFWRRVRKPGLSDIGVAAPYVIFFLSFLPYFGAFGRILENVWLYSTRVLGAKGQRPGGLWAFLDFGPFSSVAFTLLFLVAVFWAVRATAHLELSRASLLLFLTVFVFLPSWARQYLVWPIAVGALHASPAYGLFTGVSAIFLSSESMRFPWPVRFSALGTWLAGAFWLWTESVRGGSPGVRV